MFINGNRNHFNMPTLNLVEQKESAVKRELEESLGIVRRNNYALQRDYDGFLTEFTKGLYHHFSEGNRPLIAGLREAVAEEAVSIADFCCGSGKGTLRIAEAFPQAEIYGFDVMPPSIAKAKKSTKGNPRVKFQEADVYNFENGNSFSVVTFHEACGTLADKILQYGTKHEVPVIAGKFCCYDTIPDKTPSSQNTVQNFYLKVMRKLHGFIRDKVAKNYVSPRDNVDRDLLSEFAKDELGVTEEELQIIAAAAVDAKIGSLIIDLNRIMKLIERKYDVGYDEANHIVVARRKITL